jgi:IS5 family transposase
MKDLIALAENLIDQTVRRVIKDKIVPAEEKVVSLFEPHAGIRKKDRLETFYGHKVCLSVGASNLVTDCMILKRQSCGYDPG